MRRMNLRMKASGEPPLAKGDAEAIVEFLVYDSKVRKLDNAKGFETITAALKSRFEFEKKDRQRRLSEENEKAARTAPPYVGDKAATGGKP
ncbi:MAG: hypothetical protein HYZ74_00360 [Elusimicrobia bacterium]|nr:hypothetical protein [Elusimicrobiota bacterium]